MLWRISTSQTWWKGRLTGSALATAGAALALGSAGRPRHRPAIESALEWLANTQNADGGWGDTYNSPSNVPATIAAWVAISSWEHADGKIVTAGRRAESFLSDQCGGLESAHIAGGLAQAAGGSPIAAATAAAMCAATGMINPRELKRHPDQRLAYRLLKNRLIHRANPVGRIFDGLSTRRGIAALEQYSPAKCPVSTTCLTMIALAAANRLDHPAMDRCADFLAGVAHDEGGLSSTPNIAVRTTAQVVAALGEGGGLCPPSDRCNGIAKWLLNRQSDGGWGACDLPGAAINCYDTANVLLALHALRAFDDEAVACARRGVRFLLSATNADGGVGLVAGEASAADVTATCLLAMEQWRPVLGRPEVQIAQACARMRRFLKTSQHNDGSWASLLAGNQLEPNTENRVWTTATVLASMTQITAVAGDCDLPAAAGFLIEAQWPGGAWGPARGVAPSLDETAVAVGALAGVSGIKGCRDAAMRGAQWLTETFSSGAPAPIFRDTDGTWQCDVNNPLVFMTFAMGRLCRTWAGQIAAEG
jgi:squalene-hopene/tetraprenyl-beta-curcumene cyclase